MPPGDSPPGRLFAAPSVPRASSGEALPGLFDLVRLDDVARLQVRVVLEPDAAFEALRHFADVVLEAPQARDLAGVDLLALAPQPQERAAGDLPLHHRGAGDRAELRDVEEVSHLGP